MNALRAVAMLIATTSLAPACSLASGYDSSAYPETKVASDPDTQPLPTAAKKRIADPRNPMMATPAPSPEPPASASAIAFAAPRSSVVASASASAPAPPKPKPTATAATAASAAPGAPADCGSKENPCPMQKLMRGAMASASTPEALEAAFNRVAGLSPNGGWQWSTIAKKGAELAKSGDTAGAKKQCKACHDQYKDAYKAQHRGRKI